MRKQDKPFSIAQSESNDLSIDNDFLNRSYEPQNLIKSLETKSTLLNNKNAKNINSKINDYLGSNKATLSLKRANRAFKTIET